MNQALGDRRNRNLRAHTPHVLDALEPRQLLSAAIVRGVLNVQGTRRADSILIARDGRRAVRVEVNGAARSFSFRDFSRIRVTAGPGDDFLVIGNAHVISSPATLVGGDGNDTIVTSAGNDSVDAGDGDDSVATFPGDDTVHAGGGNDTVYGGDGDDSLSGDNGNDLLKGEGGNDTITGGRGDDRLYDGADHDRVYGNAGVDHFFRSVAGGDTSEFRDRLPDEALDYGVITENVGGYAAQDGVTHGDFNYEGNVNFDDLLILAKNYNGAGTLYEDLLTLAGNHGSAGTAAAAHA